MLTRIIGRLRRLVASTAPRDAEAHFGTDETVSFAQAARRDR